MKHILNILGQWACLAKGRAGVPAIGALFFAAPFLVNAQNTATNSGNWNDCATWGNPTAIYRNTTDTKTINTGVNVTLNENWSTNTVDLNGNGSVSLNANQFIDFQNDQGADVSCTPVAVTVNMNCSTIQNFGTLTDGQPASNVYSTISHDGGNVSPNQQFTSTGVTGLTATVISNGVGSFKINISGTPNGSGDAIFVITINGVTCTVKRYCAAGAGTTKCFVKISATTYKEFKCHNAGADESLNPYDFNGTKGLNGGYFGYKGYEATVTYENLKTVGNGYPGYYSAPTMWYITYYPYTVTDFSADNNIRWSDANGIIKGPYDPCPLGFKIPSINDWNAVIANNNFTRIGTWNSDALNFSAGFIITNDNSNYVLPFPANGGVSGDGGSVINRGSNGEYWASNQIGLYGYRLMFGPSGPATVQIGEQELKHGQAIRCMKE